MNKTGVIKTIYRNLRYRYEVCRFDRYRKLYNTFSIDDKIRMAGKWLKQFPEQAHFEYMHVNYWLGNIVQKPAMILEIGGWRGDLADKALSFFPGIFQWHNYDLLRNNNYQKCSDQRYQLITLDDYIWSMSLNQEYNALIATHVIEHLSWKEFTQLTKWIPECIETVLFEAPLPATDENHNWQGDHSSHILEKGWEQVISEMMKNSFLAIYSKDNTVIFNRFND